MEKGESTRQFYRRLFKPLFVAPPFGQLVCSDSISSVYGSYTVLPRAGRFTAFAKTFRYAGDGSWVNRIGLKNPGIDRAPNPARRHNLLSLAALEDKDWAYFAEAIRRLEESGHVFGGLELNLSCPNAHVRPLSRKDFRLFDSWPVILKLTPQPWGLDRMKELLDWGAGAFHLCNTYPTVRGGLSGKRLKPISLRRIAQARRRLGNGFYIVGGGGITSLEDMKDYKAVGADAFSMGFGAVLCYPFLGRLGHGAAGLAAQVFEGSAPPC